MSSASDLQLFAAAAEMPVAAITGPTATGKTRLAVYLARRFNGEIVSLDSRQIYRGLDIGTGKDLQEYSEGGETIPCYMLDVAEPGERFDLYQFLELARNAIADIRQRGKLPILCGGTPLYLAALLEGYSMEGGEPDKKLREELEGKPLPELLEMLKKCAPEELLERTDISQERRVIRAIEIARSMEKARLPQPPPLKNVCIMAPLYTRETVRERIRIRLEARLNDGLIEEVQQLHKQGVPYSELEWFGLEYRYIAQFLEGKITEKEMREVLLNRIRQFAKRQDIWFRKLQREGHHIQWIPEGKPETAEKYLEDFLKQK